MGRMVDENVNEDAIEWAANRAAGDVAARGIETELSRPSVDAIQAANAEVASFNDENNKMLDRRAAATSAVNLVMDQLAQRHSTRLSEWTRDEFVRLLDNLYADPGAAIVLGGQFMGTGFQSVQSVETTPKVDADPIAKGVLKLKDLQARLFKVEPEMEMSIWPAVGTRVQTAYGEGVFVSLSPNPPNADGVPRPPLAVVELDDGKKVFTSEMTLWAPPKKSAE